MLVEQLVIAFKFAAVTSPDQWDLYAIIPLDSYGTPRQWLNVIEVYWM
jgi:hypothetical protein